MTNSEMFSFLVGALLPAILAIIIRRRWTNDVKATIAFLACVPAALGTAYFNGVLAFASRKEITTDVLIIMVATFAFYEGFYKHAANPLKGLRLPFKIVPNTPDPLLDVSNDVSTVSNPAPAEIPDPTPAPSPSAST
jgi:hypothetical protein